MRPAALLLLATLLGAPLADAQTVTPRGDAATLDVAAWNLEFFGDPDQGPNDAFQFRHVLATIRQGEIDVWAFQEVSDGDDFQSLLDSLVADGYAGLVGPNVSAPNTSFDQKLAFVYDTSVLTVTGSRTILSGESFNFAGRLPLELTATATVGGVTRDLRIITFHAKAGGDASDRNRRAAAATALKDYLDPLVERSTPVVVLGDFNDELGTSISGGTSPYAPFVTDDDYRFATQALNDANTGTFCGSDDTCSGSSTIDHVLLTRGAYDGLVEGDRYGELTTDLPQYTATTSDHLPVLARLDLAQVAVDADEQAPETGIALQVASPARDAARLTVRLDTPADVALDVFDVRGRRVARVLDGPLPAGTHPAEWRAQGVAPGVYLVRLRAGSWVVAKRVVLVR